ncbi:MAG: hypothetical protein ACRDYY_14815, partial [Acidimicrobiales bacterium]
LVGEHGFDVACGKRSQRRVLVPYRVGPVVAGSGLRLRVLRTGGSSRVGTGRGRVRADPRR